MKELDEDPLHKSKALVHNLAILSVNVSNHGLSDQIKADIPVRFENRNFNIFDEENGSLHHKPTSVAQRQTEHREAMAKDILDT